MNGFRIGRRARLTAPACALAVLLSACGGHTADEPAEPAAAGHGKVSAAQRIASARAEFSAEVLQKIDARLLNRRGAVEVWVSLDQPAAAALGAQRAAERGLTDGASLREERLAAAQKSGTARGKTAAAAADEPTAAPGVLEAIRADVAGQRQRVQAQQAALVPSLAGLGAQELGRVSVAHNAVAVKLDAQALATLASLPGVVAVRPVIHYQKDLSETVPYVGAAAVQARGFDGRGVTVAVLDSGIDYTHRNLGGAGTAEAYAAAYGTGAPDPKNTTLDGLFPTAKVVGGFDFVGETWGIVNGQQVGTRTEDPDPIDAPTAPAAPVPTDGGHGTHVADIIAGASADGLHKGVAPGAKLVAVKVCSAISSSCNGVALAKAVDYAIDPNGDGDFSDAVDVINLSLGSNYGQKEDDLSFALGNAVKLGVVVVASAGNGSNLASIVGSPSIEPGVISVAQTQVPSATALPLVINAPAAIAGTIGATQTVTWAPFVPPGITADVAFVGRACPAGSVAPGAPEDPFLASPAGKIALIDRGGCSVSLKVDRAAKAGARAVLIGLVAPGPAVSFSFGGGDTFVPTLVITQPTSNQIKGQLAAGTVVNASIDDALSIPLAGSMASTSSRGPSNGRHLIKPEIGAPGASMSAESATGTGETAFGGTSGAAPMVTGAVALLLQAHPSRSPMQIKAMLMNSAEREVYTNSALEPGVLAPVTRIGAGELRVDRALDADLLVWNPKQSSAALSFGYRSVSRHESATEWLRIENRSRHWKQVRLASSFRYNDDRDSRAVRIDVPRSVSVPPRGHVHVPVELSVDARKLPEWVIDGADMVTAGTQLAGIEYDGYITVRDGSRELAVPWHIVPRKASSVTAQGPRRVGGSLELSNSGAAAGTAEVFALTGTSKKLPRAEQPQPGDNHTYVDLKAVGVRQPEAGVVDFGFSTFGRRTNALYPAAYLVDVDVDRDGTPDFGIVNQELNGFGATGLAVVVVFDYAAGTGTAINFVDADFFSGNVIFSLPLDVLGLADDSTFDFTVTSFDAYGLDQTQPSEVLGPMTFTPSKPKFRVVGSPTQAVPPGGRVRVPTQAVTGGAAASPSQSGLLLLYRGDAGSESDALVLR